MGCGFNQLHLLVTKTDNDGINIGGLCRPGFHSSQFDIESGGQLALLVKNDPLARLLYLFVFCIPDGGLDINVSSLFGILDIEIELQVSES